MTQIFIGILKSKTGLYYSLQTNLESSASILEGFLVKCGECCYNRCFQFIFGFTGRFFGLLQKCTQHRIINFVAVWGDRCPACKSVMRSQNCMTDRVVFSSFCFMMQSYVARYKIFQQSPSSPWAVVR